MGRWTKFYKEWEKSKQDPLVQASVFLDQMLASSQSEKKKSALDIGCGNGRDTLFLIEKGYVVTAVDPEQEGIDILRKRIKKDDERHSLVVSKAEDVKLNKQFNIISATLALPFISPKSFRKAWSKIAQHLKFGGRFSGQFYGLKHVWSADETMSFHSVKQVLDLFQGLFRINHLNETCSPMRTVSQGVQQWHEINVIAVRVPVNPERPIIPLALGYFRKMAEDKRVKELDQVHLKVSLTSGKVEP